MRIMPLDDQLSASDQLSVADIGDIAARGFKAVICNRPDGESMGQPNMAAIRAAAEAAGLVFEAIPVDSNTLDATKVAAFSRALTQLPGPVLAYCRSGTRCAILWTAARADGDAGRTEAGVVTAARQGLDASFARHFVRR